MTRKHGARTKVKRKVNYQWPRSEAETLKRLKTEYIEKTAESFGISIDGLARVIWIKVDDSTYPHSKGLKAQHLLSKGIDPIRRRLQRTIDDLKGTIYPALRIDGSVSERHSWLPAMGLAAIIPQLELLNSVLKNRRKGKVRPYKVHLDSLRLKALVRIEDVFFFSSALAGRPVTKISTEFLRRIIEAVALNDSKDGFDMNYLHHLQKKNRDEDDLNRSYLKATSQES